MIYYTGPSGAAPPRLGPRSAVSTSSQLLTNAIRFLTSADHPQGIGLGARSWSQGLAGVGGVCVLGWQPGGRHHSSGLMSDTESRIMTPIFIFCSSAFFPTLCVSNTSLPPLPSPSCSIYVCAPICYGILTLSW